MNRCIFLGRVTAGRKRHPNISYEFRISGWKIDKRLDHSSLGVISRLEMSDWRLITQEEEETRRDKKAPP